MNQKKTLVIGASENPQRYSNKAIKQLLQKGHEVVAIGKSKGEIDGVEISVEKKQYSNIDTVTLYLNPSNQKDYFDYIVELNPKRVIFNPGTENYAFYRVLEENGIEVDQACTLILLSTNQY